MIIRKDSQIVSSALKLLMIDYRLLCHRPSSAEYLISVLFLGVGINAENMSWDGVDTIAWI